eukprot:gene4300-14715_t
MVERKFGTNWVDVGSQQQFTLWRTKAKSIKSIEDFLQFTK